jgi:hypothetical protein
MAKITRASSFRRKSALRLSKYETSLEAAFKEKDVFTLTTLTGATSLDYVPDVILAPATMTGNCTVDMTVAEGGPDAYNRVVRVVNQDATYTVSIGVNSGTDATVVSPGDSVDYYIADGTATTTPVVISPAKASSSREWAASAADYAILDDDGISTVVVNDAITITMPAPATNVGRKILFVQKAAAVLTIAQNASENIAGAAASFVFLDAAGDYAEFVCDGTDWLLADQTQMTTA